MINKIILFFKAKWICEITTKTAEGITYSLSAIEYAIRQTEGSELGDKYINSLVEVKEFLKSTYNTLKSVSKFTCSEELPPLPGANVASARSGEDIDEIIKNLQRIREELDK